jgi:hypothetical protein
MARMTLLAERRVGRSDSLNLLTSRQCAGAVAGDVLRDGGGLHLEVTPVGRKIWRFRYTRPNSAALSPGRRRNRISLGEFPKPMSLAAARAERDRLRRDLASGIATQSGRVAMKPPGPPSCRPARCGRWPKPGSPSSRGAPRISKRGGGI